MKVLVACPFCGDLISLDGDEHRCSEMELSSLDYVSQYGSRLSWTPEGWWLVSETGSPVQELGRLEVVERVHRGEFIAVEVYDSPF